MLRKIANLEVYLEDDPKGLATACASQATSEGMTGKHKLVLNVAENPFQAKGANIATDMAHELGHFMANLLGTPKVKAAMHWIRARGIAQGAKVLDVQSILNPWEKVPQEIIGMESEAWDFARLIHPGLNEAQASEALDSYKD